MTDETRAMLTITLKQAEGLRLMPYADTAGVQTIGYGHAIGRIGITTVQADSLLSDDIDKAMTDLDFAQPWWRTLDEARQSAVVELCFNLGLSGFMEFVKMRAALQQHEYAQAAYELMNSAYARELPMRATRLANRLHTGQ